MKMNMVSNHPLRIVAVTIISAASFLWPASAFAKRMAPAAVPPVVWQGVEYRAPLDTAHIGYVQAFDVSSGRMLWERKVYDVRINPQLETDVQWVFISGMRVQDGKLLVTNEAGKSYRLDLGTERAGGFARSSLLWLIPAACLVSLACFVWIRKRLRQTGTAANEE